MFDPFFVSHAESLLLVDNQQPEVAKPDVLREKPMGADDDVHLAGGQILERLFLLGAGAEPADQIGPDRERGEPVGHCLVVLKREHGGRCQQADLLAVHHGFERRPHRHLGLAISDISAEEAVHRRPGLHVSPDVSDRGLLVWGEFVLECIVELAMPVRVWTERVARHRLARRVQLEQLLGHVPHGATDLRLSPRP